MDLTSLTLQAMNNIKAEGALERVPTNWAKIGMYGGIGAVAGAVIGALISSQHRFRGAVIGIVLLGGIGAVIGWKVAGKAATYLQDGSIKYE